MNPRYDTIGVGYDATRRADPYIAGRLAHHLAIGAESTYLDVACGPAITPSPWPVSEAGGMALTSLKR